MRFAPKSDPSKTLIGEPVDAAVDVGRDVYEGKDVAVNVFSGSSVLSAGQKTGATETIGQIFSPVSQSEAGAVRCIGLNVSYP